MKHIFILLLLCNVAQAQYSASFETYSIDSVSVDSFYLRTVSINTRSNTDRNDTLVNYTLFTDTTDFITYVAGKYEEVASLGPRFTYLKEERDTLAARYNRLLALGGTAESPFRSMQMPPGFVKQPVPDITISDGHMVTIKVQPGVWVIYPPSSKADFVDDVSKINCTCIVLYPNGTSEKRKKKAAPKPVKKE